MRSQCSRVRRRRPCALGAQHPGDRTAESRRRTGFRRRCRRRAIHTPRSFSSRERAREVGDGDDRHGVRRAARRLRDRRVDADRAVLRHDDRVRAERIGAAQARAEVVRIGDAVEHEQQRAARARRVEHVVERDVRHARRRPARPRPGGERDPRARRSRASSTACTRRRPRSARDDEVAHARVVARGRGVDAPARSTDACAAARSPRGSRTGCGSRARARMLTVPQRPHARRRPAVPRDDAARGRRAAADRQPDRRRAGVPRQDVGPRRTADRQTDRVPRRAQRLSCCCSRPHRSAPTCSTSSGCRSRSSRWRAGWSSACSAGRCSRRRRPSTAQSRVAASTPTPDDIASRAFYPLTMPLTVGPGSISVAITLGANPPHDRAGADDHAGRARGRARARRAVDLRRLREGRRRAAQARPHRRRSSSRGCRRSSCCASACRSSGTACARCCSRWPRREWRVAATPRYNGRLRCCSSAGRATDS